MRLYPAITLPLARVHPKDCVLDGIHIPQGTALGANAYTVHRDEAIFGSREPYMSVDDFWPERWLLGESERENEKIRAMKRRFWGFGSGGRACVGRQ
jgi:cytochrome P450